MRRLGLVLLATCGLLGGVGCAPQTVATGPDDPMITSLLEGEQGGVTDKLHLRGGAPTRIMAGDAALGERIAYDLPRDGVDLTGLWTRADFGIPDGSWVEAAAYLIEKPDGGRLKLTTSRTDLSVFVKRVGAQLGQAYDGGELRFASTTASRYAVLIAPAGTLDGAGSVGFDLVTEIEAE